MNPQPWGLVRCASVWRVVSSPRMVLAHSQDVPGTELTGLAASASSVLRVKAVPHLPWNDDLASYDPQTKNLSSATCNWGNMWSVQLSKRLSEPHSGTYRMVVGETDGIFGDKYRKILRKNFKLTELGMNIYKPAFSRARSPSPAWAVWDAS